MNLLYCGDCGVGLGMSMSLLSIAKKTDEPLNVYIFTAGLKYGERVFSPLSESYAEGLRDMLKARGKLGEVRRFDLTEKLLAEPPTANMATRFTPMCMLRLYADCIQELPEKLMYLDSDVMCIGNPSAFYNTDMAGYDVGAVRDRYGSLIFDGGIFRRRYINSGVLLINLEFVRNSGCFAEARRLCAEKKMFMPDQTAINKTAIKKILPRKYNEQKCECPDTVFRHFTTTLHLFPYPHSGTVKPWQTEKMHMQLNNFKYDDLLAECEEEMKGFLKK